MYVDNIMLTLNMSLETSDWLLWDPIFGQIECLITSTIYSKQSQGWKKIILYIMKFRLYSTINLLKKFQIIFSRKMIGAR